MPFSPDPDIRRVAPSTPVLGAFLEGWRRAITAPAIVVSILLMTLLVALPLTMTLGSLIRGYLGSSAVSTELRWNWNDDWASEFRDQSSGVGRTFSHEILGFGGTLASVSHLVDGDRIDPSLASAIGAYVLLWMFVSGGVIDRVARGRPVRAQAFFAACGVYFLRFLRLAAIVGPCYWVLFRWVYPLLFGTIEDSLVADTTAEHVTFAIRAALYVVFLGLLGAISLVADFAKVRAVVEDRRSMVSAFGASVRFIRRRFWSTSGLYLINIAAALVLVRVWMQAARPAWAPSWEAFLVAEVYLVARIWAKVAFMASEVTLFQGDLAHAGYTASPAPKWPDSPAVEAIRNA